MTVRARTGQQSASARRLAGARVEVEGEAAGESGRLVEEAAKPGQVRHRRIEPRRLVLLRKPEDAEARPVAVLRMSLLMATRIRVGMATN